MTETICPEVVICVGADCGKRIPFDDIAVGVSGRVLYFGQSGTTKDAQGNDVPAQTETGLCGECQAKVLAQITATRRIAGEIPPEPEIA